MGRNFWTRREFVVASAEAAAISAAPKVMLGAARDTDTPTVHIWQKHELKFVSAHAFKNAYTDVTVWFDLDGPGFSKRVYGFWNGDKNFCVRVVATAPGTWHWTSGSDPVDSGLAGKSGSFEAVEWTPEELEENPLRRGFVQATPNHHALQTADGSPFILLGDTWYDAGASRWKWYDDDIQRPIGPTAGFKDYVRFRKAQGYNSVTIIAAFPNWETDGLPIHIIMNGPNGEKLTVRNSWLQFGTGDPAHLNTTGSPKNVDNEGGRPFFFPGKVPGYENVFADVDRLNPEYFKYIDRKVDYLNSQGFIVFLEPARRDCSELGKTYYQWPDSYARYVQHFWSRYQANNVILSPIHLDILSETIPVSDYQNAIDMITNRFGPPPFGTLLSANSNPSTLVNWGEASWVTLHSVANKREHEYYWYQTDIFRDPNPKPSFNNEPYYAGLVDARGIPGGYKYGAVGGSEKDNQNVRSALYGNFLSGGFGGYVYGAEGIWGGDNEPAAPTKMWDAFQWKSGAQVRHLRTFVYSIGTRYQELVPDSNYIVPNQNSIGHGFEGWAYAARTPDKTIFLCFFEKECPTSLVRGARVSSLYRAQWFDPREGVFSDAGNGFVTADNIGEIQLPEFPSDIDWGLSLEYHGPVPRKPGEILRQ